MSAQVISELFQQIVHSEEKIKQRFQALKKVNQDILDTQENIRRRRHESEQLMHNGDELNRKLVEEEIELKWLATREEILLEQKHVAEGENQQLAQQIEQIENESKRESYVFISMCDRFLQEYDIVNGESITANVDKNLKQQIDELKSKIDIQHLEIAQKMKEREEFDSKEEERMKFEADIGELRQRKKNVEKICQRYEDDIENFKDAKKKLLKKKESDVEIKRLLEEIENVKSEIEKLSQTHQHLATQLFQIRQQQQHNFRSTTTSRRRSHTVETARVQKQQHAGEFHKKAEEIHRNAGEIRQNVGEVLTSDAAQTARAFTSGKRLAAKPSNSSGGSQKKRFAYTKPQATSSRWHVASPEDFDFQLDDDSLFTEDINNEELFKDG